jgi:4-amino-4-deoxy-L-arabinose transferase-like glycosyltransferase
MTEGTQASAARSDRAITLWLMIAVLVVMGLRLAMLGWPAVSDTTESRHAVIAMRMAETGDWVTPRAYFRGRLVPFWGKPPLQFWLTAASFRLLGVSEWSARLPGYLAALAMLGITFAFARRFWSREAAAASTVVLASSLLFFGLAGSVTLDVTLAASSAAAMAAFACFASAQDVGARRGWGIAFAATLALGMLIKGPIAVAFAVLSVLAWVAIGRRWNLLATYPWVSGMAVFFLGTLPWYLLAERATPGFLRYFFINEHILRFITHDYGDLYGSGHTQPFGAVWLMLLASALPWTVVLVRAAAARIGRRRATSPDPLLDYVLVWALVPPLFFTFARQLLATYLLPGFAGMAVLAGVALAGRRDGDSHSPFSVLLRWQVIVSAVAAGGLAGYADRRAGPALATVAAALGVLLLLSALVRSLRGVPGLVGVQAVGVAALMFLAVAVARPALDDRLSAKTILQRVAHDARLEGRALVFPLSEEHSADFYARLYLGRDTEHHPDTGKALLAEKLRPGSNDVLFVKGDAWRRLAADLQGSSRDRRSDAQLGRRPAASAPLAPKRGGV